MKHLFAIIVCWAVGITAFAQDVFINEVRYKGTTNERGVEIAGPAGTDLSDFEIRFYESDNSTIYHTEPLSGTIPNQSNSYGSIWFPVGNYQDSDDRAVELYNLNKAGAPENIIYYGTGSAPTINGVVATYLGSGIVQTGTLTPQLIGTGTQASDFTWVIQAPTISGIIQGAGLINTNQFFTVLPVELLNFGASTVDQVIQLSWRTASEFNNSHFEIERSTDGEIFERIAKVKGEGTTTTLQDYHHTDQPTKDGRYYYRLKQVDKDGEFEYSDVISIEVKTAKPIKVTPNPVRSNGALNIQIIDNEPVQIGLYSTTGQLMREWFVTNDRQLNLDNIQSGLYFLVIRKSDKIIERRQIIILE